jgi:ATP-dependent helicase IRC3
LLTVQFRVGALFFTTGLSEVFEEIVFRCSIVELWQQGHLAPMRASKITTDIDLSNVHVNPMTKDFVVGELASAIDTPVRNRLVVEAWKKFSKDRKSTLVFCTNVAHVTNMAEMFYSMGVDARYVHGKTPPNERDYIVAQFRARSFPVLINCGVFTEGTGLLLLSFFTLTFYC